MTGDQVAPRVAMAAFSERGLALARRLAAGLAGAPGAWAGARVEVRRVGGTEPDGAARPGLRAWADAAWEAADALVFVGAVGIAVRAVAPLVAAKASDPAVVAVDEASTFAVAVLSGHLGGANDLARAVAAGCGATPVVTTATDVRGAFAVDAWARAQGCAVANPRAVKRISAKLLAGGEVRVASAFPIAGEPPAHVVAVGASEACDVRVGVRAAAESPVGGAGEVLHVVPRAAVLGVGCRRGTSAEALEACLAALLARSGVAREALAAACSIDVKAGEPGILALCAAHGLPFSTFSAAELAAVPGVFADSDFVARTVGVGNVCERAAVRGSGGGCLLCGKVAQDGVTMALALRPVALDWSQRG